MYQYYRYIVPVLQTPVIQVRTSITGTLYQYYRYVPVLQVHCTSITDTSNRYTGSTGSTHSSQELPSIYTLPGIQRSSAKILSPMPKMSTHVTTSVCSPNYLNTNTIAQRAQTRSDNISSKLVSKEQKSLVRATEPPTPFDVAKGM